MKRFKIKIKGRYLWFTRRELNALSRRVDSVYRRIAYKENTYAKIGIREDLLDRVYKLDPEDSARFT